MARRLANAAVSFHTNDEDKDGDTHVTLTVRDVDGLVCAQVDNDFGGFPDHSDEGPFGLIIRNRQRDDLLQSGTFTIRIDPNGDDTWRFNFNLVLTFNDGSTLSGGVQGLQLSEAARQQDFGLQGVLTVATTGQGLTDNGDSPQVSFVSGLDQDLVLDVAGGSTTPGTPVNTFTRNSPVPPNQLWIFEGDGHISSALDPNLVLDAAGGIAQPGTPVNVFSRNFPASLNQLWAYTPEGYLASQMDPNLVLDVPDGSLQPGTHVQIFTRNDPVSPNQTWTWLLP